MSCLVLLIPVLKMPAFIHPLCRCMVLLMCTGGMPHSYRWEDLGSPVDFEHLVVVKTFTLSNAEGGLGEEGGVGEKGGRVY